MSEEAALDIRDLRLTYGGVHAIAGVSVSFASGGINAIVGPNGAGKTSLFNVISGHVKPTSGSIRQRGKEIGGKPPNYITRSGLSRTFQIPALFPNLTVRENIQAALISYNHKEWNMVTYATPFLRNEANLLIDLLGLYEERNEYVRQLSYGDRRILDIGMALAQQPRILLLDEPTQGVAAEEVDRLIGIINTYVKERKLTVLFTEHDMNSVRQIAERVIVMRAGQIVLDGDPDTVMESQIIKEVYFSSH